MEFIAAVSVLSIIVTKLVDTVRNAIGPKPRVLWNVLTFAFGIGVALLWEVDYHMLIHGLPPVLERMSGVWGQVVTGLGIGAVASGWHEFFDLMSSVAKARKAQAGIAPTPPATG